VRNHERVALAPVAARYPIQDTAVIAGPPRPHHGGMFERFKKGVTSAADNARESWANQGPPDLAALPAAFDGGPGGLTSVDLAVAGAYIGMVVASIEPMSNLGPEATSFVGRRMQDRLRAAGGSAPLQPGELLPGQNAKRAARYRAQGRSEEQIQLMQARMAQVAAEHLHNGWTVSFANDTRASLQLFPFAQESEFLRLQARHRYEHSRAGIEANENQILGGRVQQVRGAPYESYNLGGTLAARGRAHDAVVKTAGLHTVSLKETLAALAALGLRAVEG